MQPILILILIFISTKPIYIITPLRRMITPTGFPQLTFQRIRQRLKQPLNLSLLAKQGILMINPTPITNGTLDLVVTLSIPLLRVRRPMFAREQGEIMLPLEVVE